MKAVPVAVRASELAVFSLPKLAQVLANASRGIQEVVGEDEGDRETEDQNGELLS